MYESLYERTSTCQLSQSWLCMSLPPILCIVTVQVSKCHWRNRSSSSMQEHSIWVGISTHDNPANDPSSVTALSTRAIMYWLCTVWSTHACTYSPVKRTNTTTTTTTTTTEPRPPTTDLQPIGLWVFPYVSTTSDPESAHTRTTKNYKVPIDLEIPAPKNLSVLALIKELISSVSLHEFNFASQNFAITLSSPSLLSSFAMRLFPSICYTTSPTLKPSAKRSFGVLIELLRDAMGIIVLTAFLGTVTSAQASAQHWTVAERGGVRVHVRRWRHGTAALRRDSVSSPWSMAWIVRSSKKLRTGFVPTVAPGPPAQPPSSTSSLYAWHAGQGHSKSCAVYRDT
ncbi:hypothetical protein BDP27DRAFT_1370818 [Rhodocollybia butyracea]|uniref:Uncharacterized protein n=1 Tax=Rhodocollybia butyracea TaxID=206335 RepID=A0A9P5TY50_9AGAR|nr:hypothetical protein BDP27DRAFT_1370818 [Rhodocollybia butyracea]